MKFLITSALPYANGPLHFGHLAGAYLPADVITRHKKLLGAVVKHIGGSDEHGVAIMLNAKKAQKSYKEYVDHWHRDHKALFDKYQVEFDFFGQTSSEYHRQEVIEWFKALYEKGLIDTKESQQLYCNDCKNHLPDRFVEGTCYSCKYEHARGDECPNCGLWIEPAKLINPVCKICGSRNIKEVTVSQYYLLLSKFDQEYRTWLETKKGMWRKTVYPYVDSLTKEGLQDRAISRDLDWGIDVPLPEAQGKKLYVWFDAPIGYVSNMKQHLQENRSGEDYRRDWWQNDQTQIINFIGKDNIIFHGVIFPMMSMASGRANPVDILPANQYLNLADKQFSKSTGNTLDALAAVEQFGSDALRYYLISILPELSDSSFNWELFAARVNGELANNIGNLVNRCLKFWAKNFPDGIEDSFFANYLQSDIAGKMKEGIKEHLMLLEDIQIKKGLEKLMSLGSEANTHFSDLAPWAQFKQDPKLAAQTLAHCGVNIIILGVLLAPYLPELSSKILSHFGSLVTDQLRKAIYGGELDILASVFSGKIKVEGTPSALVPKIEDEAIKKWLV